MSDPSHFAHAHPLFSIYFELPAISLQVRSIAMPQPPSSAYSGIFTTGMPAAAAGISIASIPTPYFTMPLVFWHQSPACYWGVTHKNKICVFGPSIN